MCAEASPSPSSSIPGFAPMMASATSQTRGRCAWTCSLQGCRSANEAMPRSARMNTGDELCLGPNAEFVDGAAEDYQFETTEDGQVGQGSARCATTTSVG